MATSDVLEAPVDDPRDPSLEAVLDLHREVLLDGLNVMLPGKVVSYDATTQQAVVQPLVQKRYLAEDAVTYVTQDLPPIHNVPVEFCGTARGRLTWPVAAGDICEIRFSSASLARWVATPAGNTVDPGDDRQHDLSDAVCFVGLHSPASAPTDAPTDAVVVHLSGTTMKIGSSGASKNVLTTADGTTFMTALSGAITALGADPSVSALAALQAALMGTTPPGPVWPAGSSKLLTDG